jgi:hypothetical protein
LVIESPSTIQIETNGKKPAYSDIHFHSKRPYTISGNECQHKSWIIQYLTDSLLHVGSMHIYPHMASVSKPFTLNLLHCAKLKQICNLCEIHFFLLLFK